VSFGSARYLQLRWGNRTAVESHPPLARSLPSIQRFTAISQGKILEGSGKDLAGAGPKLRLRSGNRFKLVLHFSSLETYPIAGGHGVVEWFARGCFAIVADAVHGVHAV